jgi:hypothetical protein
LGPFSGQIRADRATRKRCGDTKDQFIRRRERANDERDRDRGERAEGDGEGPDRWERARVADPSSVLG